MPGGAAEEHKIDNASIVRRYHPVISPFSSSVDLIIMPDKIMRGGPFLMRKKHF